MSDYLEYLDESTNVVKSKRKLTKIIQIGIYLVIWAAAILSFWIVSAPSDAMGYSLIVFYVILPVTTVILSFLIGKDKGWGRVKWMMPLFFGVMYMLAEYATFSLANMTAFHKYNMPEFSMLLTGAVLSLIGLGIGKVINSSCKNSISG